MKIPILLLTLMSPSLLVAQLVLYPPESPPLRFAAEEIRTAAKAANAPIPMVRLEVTQAGPAESYTIETYGSGLRVMAADATGAMYGGLEIAEALLLDMREELPEGPRIPFTAARGLKFALPAERQLRAPQWKALFQAMARDRYNLCMLTTDLPLNQLLQQTPDWSAIVQLAAEFGIHVHLSLSTAPSQTSSPLLPQLLEQSPQLAGLRTTPPTSIFSATEILNQLSLGLKETPNRPFQWTAPFPQSPPTATTNFVCMDELTLPPLYTLTTPYLPEITEPTWLNLRTDGFHSFRWGDPEYARSYIKHTLGPELIQGFYIGPDHFNWTYDRLSRIDKDQARPFTIQQQWYAFLIWGRLAYNPELPAEHLRRLLQRRFPSTDCAQLDTAWFSASRVIPLINRFFWKEDPAHWMPEACAGKPGSSSFYTLLDFIKATPLPGSHIMPIQPHGSNNAEITPRELAHQLDNDAQQAQSLLPALRTTAPAGSELAATLNDIEMLALLGRYYSHKIQAACDLQESAPQQAIQHLETALDIWKTYAALYAQQYQESTTYPLYGTINRSTLIQQVQKDIELARHWKP